MKYKVGDKVRIKSIDWYNENKDEVGNIRYKRDGSAYPVFFSKYMSIFCGEILTIKSVFKHSYHMNETSSCEFWTDEMIEGLVEEETKPKFKIGDRVITDTNMKGKIIEVVEEGWYRVDFDDYNGISQSNGVVPEENMTIMTKETNPEPKFKVGDIIISDVFTTNDDKGWKVIDVERTGYKLISVNNSGLICDMDFKNEHYYKLVEEEMPLDKAGQITDFEYEGLAYTLPDGYIFKDENGNVINAKKIVLEKKKKEYPKTLGECRAILGIMSEYGAFHYKTELITTFMSLLICRDAYWKIAGEKMGLGKPWEPDWKNDEQFKYVIICRRNCVVKDTFVAKDVILAFPTEEMRDAFKENFDPDIEICKELL